MVEGIKVAPKVFKVACFRGSPGRFRGSQGAPESFWGHHEVSGAFKGCIRVISEVFQMVSGAFQRVSRSTKRSQPPTLRELRGIMRLKGIQSVLKGYQELSGALPESLKVFERNLEPPDSWRILS